MRKKGENTIFASEIFAEYEKIENRVVVIAESEDKMHLTDQTKRIAKLIKDSKYIDVKTNEFIHSADIVNFMREQIEVFQSG